MTRIARLLPVVLALTLGLGVGLATVVSSSVAMARALTSPDPVFPNPPKSSEPDSGQRPTEKETPTDEPSPEEEESAEEDPTPKASPKKRPTAAPTPKARTTVGATPKAVVRPNTARSSEPAPTGTSEATPSEEPDAKPVQPEDAIMANDEILKSGTLSSVDAEAQAMLVDVEDQRIVQIRAALTALMQVGGVAAAQRKQPQVFVSAHGRTLVLPARNTSAPYTIRDLEAVENGRYLRKLKDGSYLLGVHVFVADGATLQLRGPLTLRMGSLPGSFSSIIAFGGDIKIKGTARQPVRISSWDVRTQQPDRTTTDGRAYIRAVGGNFEMEYAQVSHLGFWSGRTGGIALTGTERPASVYRHRTKEQRHRDKRERLSGVGKDKGGSNFGDVETSPIGPGTATHVLADELVSGSIQHSVITGDAFGLFVSGSNQTRIINNKIVGSLVHGVFMHRFAKNATIEDTKVIGSGGDGFVLSRATEKARITNCVAERNGLNGFTINGRALAQGPSASGESLAVFGDSSINDSVARNNGKYGIEVLGGTRLAVHTSEIVGGDMGIVVREGANGVQISGNKLTNQRRQAIALRDGAVGAHVAGNTITGTVTGIYIRDSTGKIIGNKITTLAKPNAHGITVIGAAGATEITRNTTVGAGTSAISVARADGKVNKHNNDEERWKDTSSFWTKAQRYVKPMNVIWAGVILLVIVSALRSRATVERRRRRTGIHNPYELQRWMEHRPVMELRAASANEPREQAEHRPQATHPLHLAHPPHPAQPSASGYPAHPGNGPGRPIGPPAPPRHATSVPTAGGPA
ncbi:right-handed parallel beta-helix repeat-containing protein [Spongiactinospora sp. TRM90649]|uniref:right-handed parallel beta-helix repeat-containing protein n=1 Tax=Spongiactinospora sp. TRM90649 TaxID=3031114 RepID=UPI0023F9CD67|nr:right-handed parallel beta-helix repeat-containing protein [Spongiactinospora sp. TRM90649]MDF5754311.1 right-handed parallel beta-helix repeat-containing protein [Spongiactinospora sp. TRM90649]